MPVVPLFGRSVLLRILQVFGIGSCTAHDFLPFAGVEELLPRRLQEFCGEAESSSSGGIRWCSHEAGRDLEDGGHVHLRWSLNVDPDSILSLDTEGQHGVQLRRCAPNELELVLPESHVGHAAVGQVIVGSRFVHNCAHLGESRGHLYHRVVELRRFEWHTEPQASQGAGGRLAHVLLLTKELPSIAHAVPAAEFHFEYMPVEANDVVRFPKRRTHHPDFRSPPRRLQGAMEGEAPWDWDNGDFKHGGITGAAQTVNSMIKFVPKQIANFGWNWNFALNTTQDPEFNFTFPGCDGFMLFRHPHVRLHSGIFLNFSSHLEPGEGIIDEIPYVRWTMGMKGHGILASRMVTEMQTTSDLQTDPFHRFSLPILEKLAETQWFGHLDFNVANIPVSFEPGIQFKARAYHTGKFRGTLQAGVDTHAEFEPNISFDSREGLTSNVNVQLKDTSLWPPNWMIFTEHFEMGAMLQPTLWMRGQIGSVKNAKVALETRPYMNLTITRGAPSRIPGNQMKPLIVYPYRVMGLNRNLFSNKYKVRIQVGGCKTIDSSPELNSGEIEYHDSARKFNFGEMSEADVLSKPIVVMLIELAEDGKTETVIGQGTVKCQALMHFECMPSPTIAEFTYQGHDIGIAVAIVWDEEPLQWFATKIRGLAAEFPLITVHTDALAKVDTSLEEESDNATAAMAAEPFTLMLEHANRGYRITTKVHRMHTSGGIEAGRSQRARLEGDVRVNFGHHFLESWMPCVQTFCHTSSLTLFRGDTMVGRADLPEIPWTSGQRMRGTSGLGSAESFGIKQVPVTVSLRTQDSDNATVAVVRMVMRVTPPSDSCSIIAPHGPVELALGEETQLQWVVPNFDSKQQQTFTLKAWRWSPDTDMDNIMKGQTSPSVGSKFFTEVDLAPMERVLRCSKSVVVEGGPCVFQDTFKFGEAQFAKRDNVMLVISWHGASIVNEMYSAPFSIAEARRRLSATAPAIHEATAARRRLWDQEDWDRHVEALQKNCQEKNLQFQLGGGMLFRAKVEHLGVPESMPLLSGFQEAPNSLNTGFKPVGIRSTNNTDLSEILPTMLCAGGICSGTLPGCPDIEEKKLYFPEVNISFNRAFVYNSSDAQASGFRRALQTTLAYAFSVLPEGVDILIKTFGLSSEVTESIDTTTAAPSVTLTESASTNMSVTTAPEVDTGTLPNGEPMPMYMPSTPLPGTAPPDIPTAEPGFSGRRLDILRTKGRQVTLRFKEGLRYMVDDALVEMLLSHGIIDQEAIDDGHSHDKGPLRIVGFSVSKPELLPMVAEYEDLTSRYAGVGAPADGYRYLRQALIVSAVIVGVAMLVVRAARIAKAKDYQRLQQELVLPDVEVSSSFVSSVE